MRALCLSGGANKGSYQVGVLQKWLHEEQRQYEVLCGVSVGALNSSYLCQFKLGQEKDSFLHLLDLWLNIKTKDVYKHWFPFSYLQGIFKGSLYDSRPLWSIVKNGVDRQKLIESERKLRVGAVSLDTGEYILFKETDSDIVEGVLASSSYPVFLSPVPVRGDTFTDGGIRTVTPLKAAVDLGATEIDVVMTSPEKQIGVSKKFNILQLTKRVIDIMSDEIILNDIEIIKAANDKSIKINIVRPESPLTDDSLRFDQEDIRRMIEVGYDDACENCVTL